MRGNPAPWILGRSGTFSGLVKRTGTALVCDHLHSLRRSLRHALKHSLQLIYTGPISSHAGQKNRANCTARPTHRPQTATHRATPCNGTRGRGIDCDNLSLGHREYGTALASDNAGPVL